MMIRTCRRAVLLALVLLLCLTCCPTAAAASFSDVPKSFWAYSAITDLLDRGLIQGSGGKFRPNEPISQQAFLSMVCRTAGLDDRKLESGEDWSAPAMAYGFYQGWYDEDEITATSRSKPISRELAAKLLVNALFPDALVHSQPTSAFRDEANISRDRLPYVQAAVSLGLIDGYADGRFDPQGGLTRAASAALLSRAMTFRDQDKPEARVSLQVPVLMYHDVSYLGSGYSKTPEVFKKQMQELKDAGFHTVFFSQLVDYVEHGAPLPSRPIVITLDDGYRSNYEYVFPILRELDMKAEISLIGAAMQYTSWGLKWDDVREMADSGLVSFQCHTYQMHGDYTDKGGRLGVLKAPNESWQAYVEALGADTVKILDMIESKTGARPVTFTYPRGKWNTMAEAVVTSLGCKVSVTTRDGVATVTQGDPSSLHLMDRIGMDFLNGSVVSVLKKYGYQG